MGEGGLNFPFAIFQSLVRRVVSSPLPPAWRTSWLSARLTHPSTSWWTPPRPLRLCCPPLSSPMCPLHHLPPAGWPATWASLLRLPPSPPYPASPPTRHRWAYSPQLGSLPLKLEQAPLRRTSSSRRLNRQLTPSRRGRRRGSTILLAIIM
jgi:hypothetical protein